MKYSQYYAKSQIYKWMSWPIWGNKDNTYLCHKENFLLLYNKIIYIYVSADSRTYWSACGNKNLGSKKKKRISHFLWLAKQNLLQKTDPKLKSH
jgi:hypothetical protein